MDAIRFATQEEIQGISSKSDLDPRVPTQVYAFENELTGKPDFAVVKQVFEVDPVHFAEASTTKRRALMMWSVMNHLRLNGIPVVYFQIADDAVEWQSVSKNFGTEEVSLVPERRFKMTLLKDTQSGNQERNNDVQPDPATAVGQ